MPLKELQDRPQIGPQKEERQGSVQQQPEGAEPAVRFVN